MNVCRWTVATMLVLSSGSGLAAGPAPTDVPPDVLAKVNAAGLVLTMPAGFVWAAPIDNPHFGYHLAVRSPSRPVEMRCQLLDLAPMKALQANAKEDAFALAASPTHMAQAQAVVTAMNLTAGGVEQEGSLDTALLQEQFSADRGYLAIGSARPGLMEGAQRVAVHAMQRDDRDTMFTCALLFGDADRDAETASALRSLLRFQAP